MERDPLRADGLLLLAAVIWGTAFVAQRVGMESMGPLSFNAVRFALGALVVLPLALRRGGIEAEEAPPLRRLLGAGSIMGLVLFLGASLQQFGLVYTTAGKAGFITGLYVVIVPILGAAFGHRVPAMVWLGAMLATAGLYLLSVGESFRMAYGDLVVLAAALFWALHVLAVGRYVRRHAGVRLAAIQFTVCAGASLLLALLFEDLSWRAMLEAWVPIVYAGVFSVGVAYTLQLVGQRRAIPAHAAIILSLEAVFAALAGWLILGEQLGLRGLLGCALMLAGMLAAQLAVIRAGRAGS